MSDNAYNGRVSQVENQSTPSLWDRLGTARNAFRIFSKFMRLSSSQRCVFSLPIVIQIFPLNNTRVDSLYDTGVQTQCIQSVIDDIKHSHDKVLSSSHIPTHFQPLTYSTTSSNPNTASRRLPHAQTHDLPPGAIICARQIERHHFTYEPCPRRPRKRVGTTDGELVPLERFVPN